MAPQYPEKEQQKPGAHLAATSAPHVPSTDTRSTNAVGDTDADALLESCGAGAMVASDEPVAPPDGSALTVAASDAALGGAVVALGIAQGSPNAP